MSLVSVGSRSMSDSGRFRKIETVLFNGDTTSSFKIWQTRVGKLLAKTIASSQHGRRGQREAGQEATTAQIRQADARREEWEHRSGPVIDVLILSVTGPAEAVVLQSCGRGIQ